MITRSMSARPVSWAFNLNESKMQSDKQQKSNKMSEFQDEINQYKKEI